MDPTDPTPTDPLDYLYKEYVRLGDRCAAYVNDSFNDIKLYGAVGAVFAWKPITDSQLFSQSNRSIVLLLGFIAITFLATAIGIFTLMRQALVVYYLRELEAYEGAIRERLELDALPVFRWTASYPAWRRHRLLPLAAHLQLLCFLVIVLAPTIILALQEPGWYTILYAAISLLFTGAYGNAVRIVFGNGRMQGK